MTLDIQPFTPLTLKERDEKLRLLYQEADDAQSREWDSKDNYDQYMNDLLVEAAEHHKVLSGIGDISKAIAQFDELTAEQEEAIRQNEQEHGKFGDVTEWFKAVWKAIHPNFSGVPRDERLLWWDSKVGVLSVKDMSEAVGADGGFLVPPEFRAELLALDPEPNMFLQRTTRVPMGSRTVSFVALDQSDTTAGIPAWYGGLIVYRQGEATEKTLSDAQFREVDLVAHELIGYARVSNALLSDSIQSLSAFFSGPLGFRGAIMHRMETEAFVGNGVGQFQGIVNAPATITVARQTAGTITYTDLLNMLQSYYAMGGNGAWYAHQGTMATIAQIAGPAGNPSYVWNMDAVTGLPSQILGMPLFFTEKTAALGSAGDIILANPPFYLWGDREAITIDQSPHERFRNNQTAFRAVARNDGKPWLNAPYTLPDGNTQISPFVILGAGGS
jgi:HK97 family phage major capsid protein